ncbi:MAG TPA: hypothetical protein PLN86_16330 [Candidatus Hydrogenedentes bacterium]|nr:hypothetical protein [Candidatus Hydrogenedentota bacterium]
MRNLLIKEPPLQVSPTLAVRIGLNEAIALQQLHYWLANPKSAGEIDADGNKWVFNSYEEWQEDNFPFWSISTIQRIFISLEKMGLVLSSQLWATRRDMRKFYRIDYHQLDMMDNVNLTSSNRVKLTPSNTPKCDDVNKESETTTETTTETTGGGDNLEWLYKKYTAVIGLIHSAILADDIKEYALTPLPWLEYAFAQLAEKNAKEPVRMKWSYVKRVIQTCHENGGIPTRADKPTGNSKAQSALNFLAGVE